MKDSVKAFIKNETTGKYLFVLRDNRPEIVEPNTRGLVWGGIDSTDDLIGAMKRKIKEELELEVSDVKQIHTMPVTHTLNGETHTVTGYYFLAKTNASLEDIHLHKWQKAEFFNLDEIEKMDNVAIAVKEILANHKDLL